MNRLVNRSSVFNLGIIFVAAVFLWAGAGFAQVPAPLSVRLTFSKASYNLDDPNEKIGVTITLQNANQSSAVYTEETFSERDSYLHLQIKGPEPNGPLITATSTGGGSPTPPVEPPEVVVKELGAAWGGNSVNVPVVELREYYKLTEPGQYKVLFRMPFVQYDSARVRAYDYDGDGITEDVAPSNAVIWSEPIVSQDYYMTLTRAVAEKTSNIRVDAREYVFGDGSKPGVTKKPLTDIEVRLYKISDIQKQGISPINQKAYDAIATNGLISYKLAKRTSVPGDYLFEKVKKGDYLVLGCGNRVTDYKHMGGPIGADDPNWGIAEIKTHMILMTDNRGKKSPGKTTKLTGSELLIIEPEYVEWSSNQELYPFAFESSGDWGVTVSVEPPEGFVADKKNLSETVSTSLKALQFIITDVGSKWKPTKVKYKVTHKKKTQNIESEVKVKLSKKLAKEKRVPEWGE
jgi:hypothetical protein